MIIVCGILKINKKLIPMKNPSVTQIYFITHMSLSRPISYISFSKMLSQYTQRHEILPSNHIVEEINDFITLTKFDHRYELNTTKVNKINWKIQLLNECVNNKIVVVLIKKICSIYKLNF